jgi:hypothetical protein
MSHERPNRVYSTPSHPAGMADLARRYCVLIESSDAREPSWLREVAELLPLLHAAITSLADSDSVPRDSEDLTPDLDARFELFSHLRGLLGDRDGYWLEFDRVDDCHAMTGSLADDLTDIYCELKHGLRTIERHPARALRGWLNGYEFHWRRHLFDAERHLAMLAAQGRLG